MDFHPYKKACWGYAHQLLGNDLAPYSELVQRVGAGFVMEKDCVDFGKLLVAIHTAGYKKAMADYQNHLVNLGFKVAGGQISQPHPESQASESTECSPTAARPSRAGSGRHATTSSRKARR